jgi:hypothetical protein
MPKGRGVRRPNREDESEAGNPAGRMGEAAAESAAGAVR